MLDLTFGGGHHFLGRTKMRGKGAERTRGPLEIPWLPSDAVHRRWPRSNVDVPAFVVTSVKNNRNECSHGGRRAKQKLQLEEDRIGCFASVFTEQKGMGMLNVAYLFDGSKPIKKGSHQARIYSYLYIDLYSN
jgi:hypothetical protein